MFRVRLLVQENTKPLQSTLLSGYYKAKGVYAAAEDNYSRFNHPNMWFNISMISGSIVTGWVLQGFIFQKCKCAHFSTSYLISSKLLAL